jgi:hypothetical protein
MVARIFAMSVTRGYRSWIEPRLPVGCTREHPVEHEGVDVHVEIEGPTEALEHSDAAAAPVAHAVLTCPGPQVPLNGAVEKARHRPAQVVSPR